MMNYWSNNQDYYSQLLAHIPLSFAEPLSFKIPHSFLCLNCFSSIYYIGEKILRKPLIPTVWNFMWSSVKNLWFPVALDETEFELVLVWPFTNTFQSWNDIFLLSRGHIRTKFVTTSWKEKLLKTYDFLSVNTFHLVCVFNKTPNTSYPSFRANG